VNPRARLDAIRRLTWFGAGLLLWGAAILAKLISLQVLHHDDYLLRAQRQQQHRIDLSAPRGTIFDRNGERLAMSVPVQSVFVDPRHVPDKAFAAEILSSDLGLDRQEVYNDLVEAANARRGFIFIKRRISPQEFERLRGLNADWIGFEEESKRFYPDEEIAAHVVGSVFKDEEGSEGIEKGLESDLKGHEGSARLFTDVRRRGIESWVETPPQPGQPITLTIDQRLQFVAERELAAQVKAKHGRSGTVIVMNPNTGEILALANYPTFDPNKPPMNSAERRAHFNLGAQVPFEPGSIFKVLTLSTALETTNVRPDTMINCHNGALKLPGRIVHEAHGGYGMLSMADVLAKSSNIGAIEIGSRIGRDKFYEYLRNFGFGQRTGIPLPAESPGILRPLTRWGTTSLASVSMGQEVGATSLQLIRACAAVANGGLLVKPKIVLKIGDKLVPVETPKRVLRPETAITMRQMMEGVVLYGTGRRVIKLHGWTAGGKTGTAQIFEGGHYTHLYNASFMGFAPVNNPALVAIVTINGTGGNAGMGGPTAGPVWTAVMNEALRLYNIPKDLPDTPDPNAPDAKPPKPEDYDEVAEVEGDSGAYILDDDPSAMPKLSDTPDEQSGSPVPLIKTSAPARQASPATQQSETASKKPFIGPEPPPKLSNGPVAPDFRGKPMRTVVREAYAMGLSIRPEGTGVARAQNPAPGTPVQAGDSVRVLFAR
jgi:cell division protein FtsI (penicillin-binding protein 3)